MEQKKPFGAQLEAFFAGKGFYAVLFLCVAVIGVSAWSILSGGAQQPADVSTSMPVSRLDENYLPADKPAPTPAPAPVTVPSEKPKEPAAVQEAPSAEAAQPAPAPAPAPAAAASEPYFVRPVSGEADVGYSMAALVWNPTMCDWRTHDGVDLAAPLGTQVKATAAGTVSEIYEDDLLGTTVVISHGNGLESRYANLAEMPTVSVGDRVTTGQVIGAVGDSALGESGQVCHLHFAMTLDGESVDPGEYIS